MKLALDEMHAPSAARALTERGWDIMAVAAESELRGLPDEDLLAWCAEQDRLIATENIVDFARIADLWTVEDRAHAGMIFTNPKRFNRASIAYPGNLVAALHDFMSAPPNLGPSSIWWL